MKKEIKEKIIECPNCHRKWEVEEGYLEIEGAKECSYCGTTAEISINQSKEKIEDWEKELKEKLADIEHQRWADWQNWCHKILRENCGSPELEKVLERWDKQIATSYKDLTEKEKDSDREQVDRYLPLIEELFSQEKQKLAEEIENKIIKEFIESQRCLRCGKLKKNWQGDLSSWCDDCLENE